MLQAKRLLQFDRRTTTTYDWKAANDAQLILYHTVADAINLQQEGPNRCIIYVCLELQELTDSTEAGRDPGLTSCLEFFICMTRPNLPVI